MAELSSVIVDITFLCHLISFVALAEDLGYL
jgi:hypothetical protein